MPPRLDRHVAATIGSLTAEVSPLRRRAVDLVVDFALDRPLRDFVDRDGLTALVTQAVRTDPIVEIVRRRAPAAWRRHRGRSRKTRVTVGALLPGEVRARLRELVAETKPPRAGWLRDAIDPALIRKLVAPVMQDVLLTFAKRLPLVGRIDRSWSGAGVVAALGSRVRDGIERGAEQFLEAGKAVLGGLGVDLDREIDAATREFSGVAERDFRQALARRVETPQGGALLGEIQAQILDRLLVTRLEELHEDVERLPWAAVAELVAPALDHLRRLSLVERTIGEEIDAWLDDDGKRPVRELLGEAGLLDAVREHVLERGDALARELFASGGFALWIGDLLGAGTTPARGPGSARTTARRRERSGSRGPT